MNGRQQVTGGGGFLPWLLTSAQVDWTGTGLFLAVSVLFFVRVVGLSAAEVGLGLTIAALAAMPLSCRSGGWPTGTGREACWLWWR